MTRPRRATLLSVAFLVALFLLTTLTAPRWSSLLRRQGPEENEESPSPAASIAPEARVVGSGTARLFFAAGDRPGLLIEERALPPSAELSSQVRLVAQFVLEGPKTPLRATFPPDARVLDAFLSPRNVAIVNLSKEAAAQDTGTDGELLAVYSLVDSIISSLPSVKKVQILVDSSPAETLGGHVDISSPLAADLSVLASEPEPVRSSAPHP